MSADAATIFALSSGSPPAAIAVVRISGPEAGPALEAMIGRLPPPRRASYARLRDPVDSTLLDRGLALWFPGTATATGEPLAELHIHGGRAVADAVLRALGAIPGLRAAQAGEFTRRAFANGVIDLAEAEGLADLLAAETETQRRAAMLTADGALSRRVEEWRSRVLEIAARIEALLDFADEGDVAADERPVRNAAARLAEDIGALLDAPTAERLRDGVRVVLAGPPNAGKSTLLNALAQREAAIVSPIAGTTRDVVEVPVAFEGIAFLLSDTAGLHDSDDAVERIGVARAEQAISQADILLWLGDPRESPNGTHVVCVHAQADVRPLSTEGADVSVSARTGQGIGSLVGILVDRAKCMLPMVDTIAMNRRQRDALQLSQIALRNIEMEPDMLIAAEHARSARAAFDAVVGRGGVEDMLDALFGRFCIGK